MPFCLTAIVPLMVAGLIEARRGVASALILKEVGWSALKHLETPLGSSQPTAGNRMLERNDSLNDDMAIQNPCSPLSDKPNVLHLSPLDRITEH